MKVSRTWPQHPTRQDGAAILVITILLLLVATIGTLMVGRTGVTEQKAAGVDMRSKEVYSAAHGGLGYGINWIMDPDRLSDLDWEDTNGNGEYDAGDTAHPEALGETELSADSYDRTITYQLKSESLDARPLIVTVSSEAMARDDSHVNKTVSVDVMMATKTIFSPTVQTGDPNVINGPPIMVDTCMENIRGNPDVYPDGGIAVGTTRGLDPDLDGNEDETLEECLDEGHLNLNGGSERALEPPRPLWNALFGADTTEQDLREIEARDPTKVYFVDSSYPRYDEQPSWNGNNWHNSLGSEDDPVILYFDSSVGCPRINGSPTIYGIVYFEQELDEDGNPVCSYQGWGGATVHGTVAVEGDMTGFNANGEVYGRTLDFGGGDGDADDDSVYIPPTETALFNQIPGSWRDF